MNQKQNQKHTVQRPSAHAVGSKLCSVFGKCGSCQWLNTPYPEQLQAKQEMENKLFGEFCAVEPILGMQNPKHSRCKVHRVVGLNQRGEVSLGAYASGTHRFIPVSDCVLEDSQCVRILRTIEKLFRSFRISAYNEDTGRGSMRHVLLRKGKQTGEIMVVLVAPMFTFPGKNNFVKALLAEHPEITTVVLNVNKADTDFVLGTSETVLYGKGWILDSLCGRTFRLSPQSFFQVNPEQTQVLYNTAIEFAGLNGTEEVIDAYCGIGTIGLIASGGAKHVTGFELNASAVRDAKQNAALNGIGNADFFCGDATQCMMKMAEEGHRADVVFLDPPRTGSTPEFLKSAAALSPSRIVYISCGPQTLQRDLRILYGLGYAAQKIQPVDLFPYTAEHVETIALLTRK